MYRYWVLIMAVKPWLWTPEWSAGAVATFYPYKGQGGSRFSVLRCSLLIVTLFHYSDFTMRVMAFQITGVPIVCPTIYSGTDQKKTSKLRVTGLCEGNPPVTGEFPS